MACNKWIGGPRLLAGGVQDSIRVRAWADWHMGGCQIPKPASCYL